MIQTSTGFEVIVIKEIDKNRVLCEYLGNCLYSKGKRTTFYKTDLRHKTIFDFIKEQ